MCCYARVFVRWVVGITVLRGVRKNEVVGSPVLVLVLVLTLDVGRHMGSRGGMREELTVRPSM